MNEWNGRGIPLCIQVLWNNRKIEDLLTNEGRNEVEKEDVASDEGGIEGLLSKDVSDTLKDVYDLPQDAYPDNSVSHPKVKWMYNTPITGSGKPNGMAVELKSRDFKLWREKYYKRHLEGLQLLTPRLGKRVSTLEVN